MKHILVLYAYPVGQEMRSAVHDHLHALDGGPERITYHNLYGDRIRFIRRQRFDGIVLHTTFLCERWSELFETHRARYEWIRDLDCPKLAIPQDEYDHSEALDSWLLDMGVTDVFSIFGEDLRPVLYPSLHDRVHFREVLTGYIDEAAANRIAARLPRLPERSVDLVYRATKLPYWFGSHGQLKHEIAEVTGDRAPKHGLTVDISTRQEDTIFGEAWSDFLMSGRAVIGAESGSSVLDRRGEVRSRVRSLLAEQPDLTFAEVSRQMPDGWDAWRFFAISPRHLEAVTTKTAQVLVEGSYSGVLEADRHYIPLRRDFSNIDEVLDTLHDHRLLEEMVERTFDDIVRNGTYLHRDFAAEIRRALGCDEQSAPALSDRTVEQKGSLLGNLQRRLRTRRGAG